MRKRHRIVGIFFKSSLALAIAVVFLATGASACPTCKQAFAEAGNDLDLVRGFGWSIIFMMSTPFLILAGLGAYFYVLVRQASKESHPTAAPFS